MSEAIINNISDNLPLASVSEDQDNNHLDIDNITQLELLQALMQVINSLQKMEQMLSDTTSESLSLQAKISSSMIDLSEDEYQRLQDAIDDYNKELDKASRHELMHKIFGTIAAALAIAIGVTLCATGVGVTAGATMIFTGLLAVVTTNSPEALDKMIDFISGGNEQIACIVKTAIIGALTVTAAIAGGPAAAVLMFTTMFSTLNPIEDYATAIYMDIHNVDKDEAKKEIQNNQNLQYFIMAFDFVLAMGGMIIALKLPMGNAEKAVGNTVKTAEKVASKAESEGIEMKELSSATKAGESLVAEASSTIKSADSLVSATEDMQGSKNLLQLLKTKKFNPAELLRTILVLLEASFQGATDGVSVFEGLNNIDIGKTKEEFAILQATATMHETTNSLLADIQKLEESFLQNILKTYQNCSGALITEAFSDEQNFAKLLAQAV